MKEFLKTNTVTYNLMSFTAFKSMLIFSLLLESPKTYKQLKDYIREHEYIHEEVSTDTLRIYINSLREIGCNVIKIKEKGFVKYSIDSHPFLLTFNDEQIENIIKVYKSILKSIDIEELMELQSFFNKISEYTANDELKQKLITLSPISQINQTLIQELTTHAQNNHEIVVYYNSPISGKKNITILADKITIENSKLYLCGFNSEYNNYSKFLVDKIIKIVSVNIQNKTLTTPEFVVGYQYLKDKNENFILSENEKLVSEEQNKLIIELSSKNKFEIIQRIMFLSSKCKVLYPADFKSEIVSTLKKMKEGYFEKR